MTVVAVGGVKLVYAYLADKAGRVFSGGLGEALSILASGIMVATGVWVIVRA